MFKDKNNGKIKRFKNVNGKFIDLFIVQKRLSLNITVRNVDFHVHRKITLWLLFIFIVNILCYPLNILPTDLIVVVGFITIIFISILSKTIKEGTRNVT